MSPHRRRPVTYVVSPAQSYWIADRTPPKGKLCYACRVNQIATAVDILCVECLRDWEDIG
jgi:hypothetical protein